jgi:putative membrane protein
LIINRGLTTPGYLPHLQTFAIELRFNRTMESENLMKRTLIFITVGTLVAGCAGNRHSHMGGAGSGSDAAGGSDVGTVAPGEASFARRACQSGVAEAEIAKLASTNTKNEEVRKFAQKLVTVRTQAEKELTEIFAHKGLRRESTLAHNLQNALDRLAQLQGRAFDQAFRQQVIEDHQTAIQLFQDQAEHGTDPDLKAFAEKYLPELQADLATAQQLSVTTGEAQNRPPPSSGGVNSVLRRPQGAPAGNIPR